MSGSSAAWKELPLGQEVVLLATDPNGLGALSKPAGILAHPNAAGPGGRSLLEADYNPDREAYEWKVSGAQRSLFLLNRLDSSTSGVILVSHREELAKEIRALFRARLIKKTYVARVFGRGPPISTTWRDRLQVEKTGGMIRSRTGGGILSEAIVSSLRTGKQVPITSLLKLEPHTGRSHQLRVQCASRGLPVVGDQTYGDFKKNREFARLTGNKRLFLHSLETKFEYDWKGRQYTFSAKAPLPPDFESHL